MIVAADLLTLNFSLLPSEAMEEEEEEEEEEEATLQRGKAAAATATAGVNYFTGRNTE